MKNVFKILLISAVLMFAGITAMAQCDRNSQRPIRCGYYDEGYEDGANDARGRLTNDYRRYRDKLDNRYEDTYRDGYVAGYAGSGGGSFPPGGGEGNSSTAGWSGRVDNRANIIIRGNNIRTEDVTNSGLQINYQNVSGYLPRRSVTVTASKTTGRGSVTVIQQPNRSNNFTAIVQISDPRSGADNYDVNISWQGSGGGFGGGGGGPEESYRAGRVVWRGNVDQTANIIITGSDVETQTLLGNTVTGDNFNISGYLARRPGNVTVRKMNGRGAVTIVQQPTRQNDYTAIVQIFDPSSGADSYVVEITW